MKMIEQKNKQKQEQQKKFSSKIFMIKKDLANKNLLNNKLKEQKQIQQKIRQNSIFQSNTKKQQQQYLHQKQLQSNLTIKKKNQLAIAYQNKIHQNLLKKYQLKKQDALYMENSIKVIQNKQQQRKIYLQKIRYGYHQNQKAYDVYSNVIKRKDEQRQKMLAKILYKNYEQNPQTPNKLDTQERHKTRNQQEIQKSSDRGTNKTEMSTQQLKKIELRRYLENQIKQNQIKKLNQRKMDYVEFNLNLNSFKGNFLIPGVSNDYSKNRQKSILNQSLGITQRIKTMDNSNNTNRF